ncbi:MAG: tRNA pseudouridine(55) synthase TruB [Roseiflexaceae bacterium]
MMHGFLNIDKPAGPTSHDVVAQVRRLARQKRVGHAGTLDPAATGVLVVALGVATRLIEYVQDATSKGYRAIVRLGVTTATDDAEGEVLHSASLPSLDQQAIEVALAQFRGATMQIPPMYAALHHEGRRLHELARAGVVVERAARPIMIDRLALLDWSPPLLTLDILCGKGTYIRALARDLGATIGCGAHLQALRRTAVGAFRVEDAVPLDALVPDQEHMTQQPVALHPALRIPLSAALLPPEQAVADWPAVAVDAAEERQIRNGQPIGRAGLAGERASAYAPDGSLLALLARTDDRWKPVKVFDWSS